MNKIFFLRIQIILLLFLTSCDEDTSECGCLPDELIGEWKVVSVHDMPGVSHSDLPISSSGTIKFYADGTGKRDYNYTYGNISESINSNFTWKRLLEDKIAFDIDTDSETHWSIINNSEEALHVTVFKYISNENPLLMVIFLEK